MLIYLQVVLVFQIKSRRVHWQLLVLSVLLGQAVSRWFSEPANRGL